MKSVPAGEFKQTCLRLLDQVSETGEPLIVTKRGVPVAQIIPIPRIERRDWGNYMAGTGRILSDLIEPTSELSDWEVEAQ